MTFDIPMPNIEGTITGKELGDYRGPVEFAV